MFEHLFFADRPKKKIFFWRIAPVSLVLGLEHSCPWPQERSVLGKAVLGLGFGFFCVLGFGLEPCVFDSTSADVVPNLLLNFEQK